MSLGSPSPSPHAVDMAESLFFAPYDLPQKTVEHLVTDALHGMEDGELFLEYTQEEALSLDEGRIKHTDFSVTQGFGLRGVIGDLVGYAHSDRLSMDALRRASSTIAAVKQGFAPKHHIISPAFNTPPLYAIDHSSHPLFGGGWFGVGITGHAPLYTHENPLNTNQIDLQKKIDLLYEIDRYIRNKHHGVRQVSASLTGEWQVVHILRPGAEPMTDIRPLVRLSISVVVANQAGLLETGSSGVGGRATYEPYMETTLWQHYADRALNQALCNLEARPAPAGEMPVLLGPGWPGVLLHEAVGHGLEGDFNRKELSAFSHLMGQRVASESVTVVDDGTLPHRRGSLAMDDEGTSSQYTMLIENGILRGYMYDRMNARLMGVHSTGNGRRESYACEPMPRMTNTYMLPGDYSPEEMMEGIKHGLYAPYFRGGQVDITSGKFVFSMAEAYMIENGKIAYPVKGATLIGNGPDILTKVQAVGNDLELDPGIGTCGKNGQTVPVCVGQPSVLVSAMTVGGTDVAAASS